MQNLKALLILLLITPALFASGKKSEKSTVAPEPQKIIGEWVRPDGGYIIKVTAIKEKDKLDAGYFNPKPIDVINAKITQKKPKLKFMMELSGQGYDGSKYKLEYNEEYDMLMGTYLQGASRQTYQVMFKRKE